MNRQCQQQGCIATCLLCCHGTPVDQNTDQCNNYFGVIQSDEIPDAEQKTKHFVICYHDIREAIIAARLVKVHLCNLENFPYVRTKHSVQLNS